MILTAAISTQFFQEAQRRATLLTASSLPPGLTLQVLSFLFFQFLLATCLLLGFTFPLYQSVQG